MRKRVLDFTNIASEDSLACGIALIYQKWRSARNVWETEKLELRNYLFATDTTQTTNATLPWKNSTTIPKLCQIRDNLHANYMSALFPNDRWFKWEAATKESADKVKARVIEAYMRNKLEQADFRNTVSQWVLDYIDFGNCIADVSFEEEYHETKDGLFLPTYIGPKAHRISPFDIVFDITARTFEDSPKITRTLVSLGDLRKLQRVSSDDEWIQQAFQKAFDVRSAINHSGYDDVKKSSGLSVDGFGSWLEYYNSGSVEILEFEGDFYDQNADVLLENYRITIIDRDTIVRKEPMPSWFGRSNKRHAGWRQRPDNLLAMGPLDNLVGMQYRVDHLENLRADVFDQIALPPVYQKGFIEDWEWGPGERIYGDVESDIKILAPDTTALNADFQINQLMNTMELMAGAPREAMGIRTPGEKTAFEVQQLQNAASRVFQNKIQHFEHTFLEPVLNVMIEEARRNLREPDVIRTLDPDFGAAEFITITPDDLKAKGKLIPIGARHFAQQAQIVQNLENLGSSALYADPSVNVHISGKRIAKLLEEQLNLDEFELVRADVRVAEAADTQRATQTAQDQVAQEAGIAPELGGASDEELDALQGANPEDLVGDETEVPEG